MYAKPFVTTLNTFNALVPAISYFGYVELDRKWHGTNVLRPYNRLYLIEDGEGFISFDGKTVLLQPGNAYLVPAGLTSDFWCSTKMAKLYFHFNVYRPDNYDLFLSVHTVPHVPVSQETLAALHAHGPGTSFADSMIIKHYFWQILTQMQQAYGFANEPFPNYSKHVMDTITYVKDHLSASLQVEELAKQLFVSRSFLAAQFRKEVGVSIGKYIDDQLMDAAKWRLGQSDASIMEISQELGYTDHCYFSRRFKQLCGMTPQVFRRRHRL